MKKNIIKLDEINPHIRFASFRDIHKGYDSNDRHLLHYQAMYIYEGEGTFITNTNTTKGTKGNFFIWDSYTPHRVIAPKESSLFLFGLQFDLTKNHKDKKYPITWFSKENYNPDYANESLMIEKCHPLPNCFQISNLSLYEQMLFTLIQSYRSNLAGSISICESILKTLIVKTISDHISENKSNNKKSINNIINYIYSNIDKKLTNKSIAEHFHYHPNYLNRLFKENTNSTLHQFVIDAKINQALTYMQSSNLSLTQIASKLSFSSVHHFSKCFHQNVGTPPTKILKGDKT